MTTRGSGPLAVVDDVQPLHDLIRSGPPAVSDYLDELFLGESLFEFGLALYEGQQVREAGIVGVALAPNDVR